MRLSVLVNGKSHCLGSLGYPPPLSLIFAEESPRGLTCMGLSGLYHFSPKSTLLIWELSHHGFPRLSAMALISGGPPSPLPTLHPGNSLMEECWADFLFLASQGSLTFVSWAPIAWNHCGIYCINFLVVSGRRLFPSILANCLVIELIPGFCWSPIIC